MLVPVRPLLAVAALAVVCGCAQTGRLSGPLAALGKPAAVKKDDGAASPFKPPKGDEKKEEKDAADKQVAAAEPTAAKPDPAAEAKPVADAKPPAVAEAKPIEPPKAEPAKPGVSHDAETLALIEAELAQASPADRAKLYEEFKTLDGEMVRQLIRINRMVRDLETSRVAAADPTAAPLPAGANAPAPPGSALASIGAEPDVRVLNLGGTSTSAPPISSIPPVTTAGGELLADARPDIRPAGHSVPMADASVRTTAAVGHSTTRPIPVLDSLAGIAANGPPAAPAASMSGTPRDAWSAQLRQLIAVAESRADGSRVGFLDRGTGSPADAAARKAYLESQVHLRLLYLMAGEQARAMQAIPGLDAADQEFWQQVLWGLSNYFDEAALPGRADRASQTVEHLRTAITRLQSEANLSLRNVAFCHKITSFGNYEKFERDEYQPGVPVLLYAEVTNFKSVPQPSDGLYRTQLKSTLEIYRAGEGQPVTKIDFEPTTDLCRSYRQDYFHSYELKIPSTLALGPHVLKLTVEDLQTGKLATYSVNFTVK